MIRLIAFPLVSFAMSGCAVASDVNTETPVDPASVAGDFKGVTGTVERLRLLSDLVAPRDIEIWLPDSYGTQPERRYPVLYMQDGQNVFDPSQSKYSGWDWGVDEALSELEIDVIVVALHSVDTTRNADYFPQKAYTETPEILRDLGRDIGELNADNYLRYLTEVVKPHIDRTYRTRSGRSDTSIMGSSMGGLISLYAISEYPNVFGAAGLVSTHFPLADGALVAYFSDRLPEPTTHRLYFDYGTRTLDHNYEGYQDRMDAAVMAAGYARGQNWTTRKFEGHDHSERAWRNRVDIPLRFLLSGENVVGGEEK